MEDFLAGRFRESDVPHPCLKIIPVDQKLWCLLYHRSSSWYSAGCLPKQGNFAPWINGRWPYVRVQDGHLTLVIVARVEDDGSPTRQGSYFPLMATGGVGDS